MLTGNQGENFQNGFPPVSENDDSNDDDAMHSGDDDDSEPPDDNADDNNSDDDNEYEEDWKNIKNFSARPRFSKCRSVIYIYQANESQ